MTPSLECLCERIVSEYLSGKHLALFLDYDGTLVPFAEHPRLAKLDRHGLRLLDRLSRRSRVHIAIVSGRSLDDLKSLIPLRRVFFAGTGGMELELGTPRVIHPLVERTLASVSILVARLKEVVAGYPGAWVEDKGLACTVHYRAVAPSLIDAVCEATQHTIKSCRTPMDSLSGPMAVEIAPAYGWNKATGVRMVLEHLGMMDLLPFYAGDSSNDAAALAFVNSIGGITVGVGRDAPAAGFRIACPAVVWELLKSLDDRLVQIKRSQSRADEYLALYGLWKQLVPLNCS